MFVFDSTAKINARGGLPDMETTPK